MNSGDEEKISFFMQTKLKTINWILSKMPLNFVLFGIGQF